VKRDFWLVRLSLLAALAAAWTAPTAAEARPKAAASVAAQSQVCADVRLSAAGERCIRPLSAEEQHHRSVSYRLELTAGRAVRLQRLNGRGFGEPDDNGCIEYRFRFVDGVLAESIGYGPDGSVCDRSLFSERAGRVAFIDAWGRPDFSSDRVHTGMRYERNQAGFVTSARPLASDGTPSTIQLASELRYERDESGIEKRMCYFDAQGKPTSNLAGVHCIAYEHDEFGNYVKLSYWGVNDEPVSGVDGAHSVVKQFDRYGNQLRSTELGLDDKPLSTDMTWCPVLAYQRDAFGYHVASDCLDGNGKLNHFNEGNAMWRATPDARGQTREVRYYDDRGNPVETSFGYARYELDRDRLGHVIERRYFHADGSPGQKDGASVIRYEFNPQFLEVKRSFFSSTGKPWRDKGCVALASEYDSFRQMVKQTCQDLDGKPALSNEKVAITSWRFDAQGRVVERQNLDALGQLTNSKQGVARRLFSSDARGVDGKARHFKADGSERSIPRYSVLWVRPPHADGFWPSPSRALALAKIQRAERELAQGMPWIVALQRFGDEKVRAANPGDSGYLDLSIVYPVLREALEPLAVGQYSPIIELPHGLALYLRTE
jgi:hypothetical protein